jgi:metal-dependent amidase/aminoacylase/carboxypeptidase family protein
VGKILYKTGAVTANSDRFQIDILGKGGHASTPEQTIDALQIAVNVSSEIFQIRGRSVK